MTFLSEIKNRWLFRNKSNKVKEQNMIVTFLGTAAANAFPEAFCKCKNCEQARALGGSSLRKRSAVLVNDDLIIDLNPDIMAAS
jgi:phosphoribosyl 1,2-cyclic phosphate phosphodiesterase